MKCRESTMWRHRDIQTQRKDATWRWRQTGALLPQAKEPLGLPENRETRKDLPLRLQSKRGPASTDFDGLLQQPEGTHTRILQGISKNRFYFPSSTASPSLDGLSRSQCFFWSFWDMSSPILSKSKTSVFIPNCRLNSRSETCSGERQCSWLLHCFPYWQASHLIFSSLILLPLGLG